MSKKWFLVYLIAILLLPVVLLVTIRLKSPSEIIVPPGYYGATAEVQAAFTASLAPNDRQNVSLKYPVSGNHRTAFVVKNLDKDEEKEVIVFYSLSTEETVVRMNILDKIDGEWISVYDEPGYGSEIVSVDFDDLNEDGETEVLCNWSLYDSQSSMVLSIYSVKSMQNKPIQMNVLVTQTNYCSNVIDIDNDGKDEILLICNDSKSEPAASMQKTSAFVLKMLDDDKIVPLGKPIPLDSAVSFYGRMRTQKDAGSNIAFIDAFKGDNIMITEALFWDADKQSLAAPLFDNETLSNNLTTRSPAVPSIDYDEDGIVDIPVNGVFTAIDEENNKSTDESKIELTHWKNLINGSLVTKSYAFVNANEEYWFKVPDSLAKNLLAYKTDTGVMTVYTTTDGKTKGEPLFSLVSKKKTQLTEKDTYTFKKENDEYVVYGTLTSAGKALGFSDDKMAENIYFLVKGV